MTLEPATLHSDPGPAIVIPAFNEASCIGEVLQAIRANTPYRVIVVDDASTDGTRKEALAGGATVLSLAVNLGAWGATQAGMRYALRHGHRTVVTMDADGQHDPGYIDALLGPVMRREADVVIGACTERGSRSRRLAWRMLAATSGLRFEDLTSGFRAYGPHALRALCNWRATFLDYQDIGVLSLLHVRGFSITDLKVPMKPRTHGHSRVFSSWLIVAHYMCHTLLLGTAKRSITHPSRRGAHG
jgi:glycosyltransferase involved in cell wall biosynthesis